MTRTTVNVDDDLLADAQEALETSGVSDTVNAALREAARRVRLRTASVHDFDITDELIEDARRDRTRQ